MSQKTKRVYVDADSCPVKNEIISVTSGYNVEVLFVSSYAHLMSENEGATIVQVDSEKEAVDLYIMNNVAKNDLVITQDHGLASILLATGVNVISPRGVVYEEGKVQVMLEERHFLSSTRRAGKKTKGPKKFSLKDRNRFCETLEKILSIEEGI